ncbi:MAG: hypothetical protein ACYTG3_05320 [Planctomycetota bacterium]
MHRAVFDNKAYIKFSRKNCVEVMAMQDIERALAERPKRAATYKTKDAYGDEIECFVKFPGVTIEQMRALIEGPALEYMEGPLMPYMGVVDPHSLKTIGGVKRGEPYTASHFIAAIKPHVEALKEKYGQGVDRKVWDGVNERLAKVDVALGGNGIARAMELYREMAKLAGARPADAVKRRLDSTLGVILGDAKERLDALEARTAKGGGAKVKGELTKLAKALEGTKLEKRAATALAAAKK